jgi:3-isopropylmalate/(R)-2-methylmalate dehydratase small subunit
VAVTERKIVDGKGMPVIGNEIDTDAIIPARFMKCVTFDGIEKYAFYDERFDDKGNEKKHPFNETKYKTGSILIVNNNFGCGSSREHAPQALMRFCMTGIIGQSFAEIFHGNCTSLGIPAVTATGEQIETLQNVVMQTPDIDIRIDLENKTVTYGDTEIDIEIPEAMRKALINAQWDSTSQLIVNEAAIREKAKKIPYMNNFA